MTEKKLHLQLTSNPFTAEHGAGFCAECRRACAQYGYEFGIQLHNSAPEDEIERCASYGVPLSAHLPLLAQYNINLAAEHEEEARHELTASAALMQEYGIGDAVFHGFRMTDEPTPAFNRTLSYRDAMKTGFRTELSYDGKSCFNADFTTTPEFLERRGLVRERLERVRGEYPGLTLCIENDFPSYGAANMFSRDMIALKHPICLDVSHLWTSCHLLGRDFHEEAEKFVASGLVRMVHFHASIYTTDIPILKWNDGHQPLRTPNRMDLPRLARLFRKGGLKLIVLEIPDGSLQDIHDFAQMWEGTDTNE
jgi:sugar phosphate isomerase/epimerase